MSLVLVLDELQLEIPGVEGAEAIMREVESRTGTIPAVFHAVAPPTPARRGSGGPRLGAGSRPAHLPRFVVMEAKFGFHARQGPNGTELSDTEWKHKLSPTQGGRQMSRNWIDTRINDIYPRQPDGTRHATNGEIYRHGYARWLYGCQPHNSASRKGARPRGGRSRVVGLAFFPPYALKGYDIDGMGWNI